jgi:hypothetical protein
MYILKIKGTNKIPDYIQIRDDNFTLIAYFKLTSPKRALSQVNLAEKMDRILEIAYTLPYGKIEKLDL